MALIKEYKLWRTVYVTYDLNATKEVKGCWWDDRVARELSGSVLTVS